MRKVIIGFLFFSLLLWPTSTFAAGFNFNINIIRSEEGGTSGEITYNDKVLWRIRLLSDDSRPVLTANESATTLVLPDVDKGFFMLKIYNY